MSNRYETIDAGCGSMSLLESTELVDEDAELQVPQAKRALELGDPPNTALIVIGTNNERCTREDHILRSLDGE